MARVLGVSERAEALLVWRVPSLYTLMVSLSNHEPLLAGSSFRLR